MRTTRWAAVAAAATMSVATLTGMAPQPAGSGPVHALAHSAVALPTQPAVSKVKVRGTVKWELSEILPYLAGRGVSLTKADGSPAFAMKFPVRSTVVKRGNRYTSVMRTKTPLVVSANGTTISLTMKFTYVQKGKRWNFLVDGTAGSTARLAFTTGGKSGSKKGVFMVVAQLKADQSFGNALVATGMLPDLSGWPSSDSSFGTALVRLRA